MHYNIFIDESGGFKEDFDRSIVGGLITNWNNTAIQSLLEENIKRFNKINRTNFNIDDIHIAPLLHPEAEVFANQYPQYENIELFIRKNFAKSCLEMADKVKLSYAASKNESFSFGKADEQSRYGTTLIALLHKTVDYCLGHFHDIDSITIAISNRHPQLLPKGFNTYNAEMCNYLEKILITSLPDNIELEIECYKNKLKPGLIVADVACYYIRDGSIIDSSIITTYPNECNFISYKKQKELTINEFINMNRFDVAYQFSPDKNRILNKFGNLTNPHLLEEQLKSFLNIAFNLVEHRTLQANALEDAMDIFNVTENISRREFDKDRASRNFFETLLASIDGKITCLNHQGVKGQQEALEAEYINLVKEYPKLTSGALNRSEKTLKLRNRAYNNEFNNYEFDKIIEEFTDIVNTRITQFQKEPDELTGEMCGTIGQAHAFLAGTDDSEFHNAETEKYFWESINHFIPGHKYHKMSVNYLATLYWQKMDYVKAIEAFSMHDKVPGGVRPEKYIKHLISQPEVFDMSTAFDLSVLLRIAAEQGTVEKAAMIALEKFLDTHKVDDHPYELLFKWMGIAYLRWNENKYALSCFDESIRISDKLDFTVKTIALSSVGLRIVTHLRRNDETRSKLEQIALIARLRELIDISSPFSLYIEKIGGEKKLLEDIENRDTLKISRWMPFSYA